MRQEPKGKLYKYIETGQQEDLLDALVSICLAIEGMSQEISNLQEFERQQFYKESTNA